MSFSLLPTNKGRDDESENHNVAITTVITVSAKKHRLLLNPVGENLMRNRTST